MYSFLIGVVEEKLDNLIILNVNNVGYELLVSTSTANSVNIGDTTKIFTYLQVKEDGISLFGFANIQEKAIFTDLITVSGVGAKTAIQILSGGSTQEIITAIVTGDIRTISSIKGIGKKTAERIVLELRNKYDGVNIASNLLFDNSIPSGVNNEAITLLVNMGLSRLDATNLVKQVASPNDTIEEIVTKALRNMG